MSPRERKKKLIEMQQKLLNRNRANPEEILSEEEMKYLLNVIIDSVTYYKNRLVTSLKLYVLNASSLAILYFMFWGTSDWTMLETVTITFGSGVLVLQTITFFNAWSALRQNRLSLDVLTELLNDMKMSGKEAPTPDNQS